MAIVAVAAVVVVDGSLIIVGLILLISRVSSVLLLVFGVVIVTHMATMSLLVCIAPLPSLLVIMFLHLVRLMILLGTLI